jgi:pSer/pThr/pTyr-binding forkhead associated (FHA) protein
MARLLIKTAGLENRLLELKLGPNRIGRDPESDFQIVHPTVSSLHCELLLSDVGVKLRDLESTNGTFVDGKPVKEVDLVAGQLVRLGDVQLLVENTDANVAIPQFNNLDIPAPPVMEKNGAILCRRHPHAPSTHQCTACKEAMCDRCVHRVRRKGGKITLLLCPHCSSPVELIGGPKSEKKKSIFTRVGETVKMKLTRVLHINR